MGTELHAERGPRIEMSLNIDGTAATLGRTNGPVLLECAGSLNRWLVGTCGLEDTIAGAIAGDCALLRCSARGVICAEVLDDVVLDEWALGPSVDGEVGVAVRAVGSAVADGTVERIWSVHPSWERSAFQLTVQILASIPFLLQSYRCCLTIGRCIDLQLRWCR